MLMLAVVGSLSLGACSSDDDNNANVNPNADLVGTYKMTAWNAPMSLDFNGDGTSNTNMMNESTCYNNSEMIIENDGSYTMTYNYVNIDGSGNVSCQTETTFGTWTRNGNSFTTTHLSGGQNMDVNYNFAAGNSTTLTRNMTNWNYPMLDIDGNAAWGNGNVNLVMTRQ